MGKNIAVGLLLFGVTACSTTTYRYIPEKKLAYTRLVNGKIQNYDINPLYHDLEKSGIIGVYFIYAETQANWPNLEAVEIDLFDGDKKIPVKKSTLKIAYWDGKNRVEIQKENFVGALYELYPATLKDYAYNASMFATFTYELEYAAKKFPEALRQNIFVRFREKTLNFENNLKMQKIEREFISGRPFG